MTPGLFTACSLEQILQHATTALVHGGIEDASLEAELLLRHAQGISLAQLFLQLEEEITPEQATIFWHLVERRLNHEPVAYIMGYQEFYGLDFYVDPRVLIPRPESELLVEKALEHIHLLLGARPLPPRRGFPLIADIGTGSGTIAISLALNLPQARVYATDISAAALRVATMNCRRHRVTDRVILIKGNLLNPLPDSSQSPLR